MSVEPSVKDTRIAPTSVEPTTDGREVEMPPDLGVDEAEGVPQDVEEFDEKPVAGSEAKVPDQRGQTRTHNTSGDTVDVTETDRYFGSHRNRDIT